MSEVKQATDAPEDEVQLNEPDVEAGAGDQAAFSKKFKSVSKPYGASLISVLFATGAYVCSVVANYTCNYVSITAKDSSGAVLESYSRGIWKGQTDSTYTCSSYGDGVSIDAKWKTARAFGVITTIFGSFAMLLVLALYAAPPTKVRLAMISIGSFCMKCCLFQGLTLILLPSSACKNDPAVQSSDLVSCDLDDGANLTITAIVLWLVAACCMAPSPDEMEVIAEEQDKGREGD